MNAIVHRQLNRRQRRILRRLENQPGVERPEPMMTASNIHYETRRTGHGPSPPVASGPSTCWPRRSD